MSGMVLIVDNPVLYAISDYQGITPAYSRPEWTFIQLVLQCRGPIRQLVLKEWDEDGITPLSIEYLAARGTFAPLATLHIGWLSVLSTEAFFALLSVAPALTELVLGSVLGDNAPPSDVESWEHYIPSPQDMSALPLPACRLRRLVVSDDWDVDFMDYAHLLCNSHDTLEHLELSWIFSPDIGRIVVEVLKQCTRVRSLQLIGNVFAAADIIAACPRVDCLALEDVPTAAELAALKCPLRELRFLDCRPSGPEHFVEQQWTGLEALIPRLPALGRIRLLTEPMPDPPPDAYRALRDACARQRIHLVAHSSQSASF